METYQAIISRKMVAKMSEVVPPREVIGKLLQAAVRAPTHHLTQPWRFIVLSGSALDELGEAMTLRVLENSGAYEDVQQKVELERGRPRRAPVIVVVVYVPSSNPKAIEVEDRYAVGAAIENILLAAHSMGLGAYWRTGPAASDRHVASHLELGRGEEIAGFVYVGYSEEERPETPRADAETRTEWRGFG